MGIRAEFRPNRGWESNNDHLAPGITLWFAVDRQAESNALVQLERDLAAAKIDWITRVPHTQRFAIDRDRMRDAAIPGRKNEFTWATGIEEVTPSFQKASERLIANNRFPILIISFEIWPPLPKPQAGPDPFPFGRPLENEVVTAPTLTAGPAELEAPKAKRTTFRARMKSWTRNTKAVTSLVVALSGLVVAISYCSGRVTHRRTEVDSKPNVPTIAATPSVPVQVNVNVNNNNTVNATPAEPVKAPPEQRASIRQAPKAPAKPPPAFKPDCTKLPELNNESERVGRILRSGRADAPSRALFDRWSEDVCTAMHSPVECSAFKRAPTGPSVWGNYPSKDDGYSARYVARSAYLATNLTRICGSR